MGQYFPFLGLQALMSAWEPPTSTFSTGSGLASSPVATITVANPAILPGMLLLPSGAGANFPPDTYVVSNVGTTVTLSQNSTGAWGPSLMTFASCGSDALDFSIDLLTGTIPNLATTVYTDLTLATYDGYVAQAVTLISAVLGNGAYAWVSGQCLTFVPSDYTVPNLITGLAWSIPSPSGGSRILIATETFANAVPLSSPGDAVQVTPILAIGNDQTSGPASPLLTA